MPSINSLVARLSADYPSIQFEAGSEFMWSPSRHTVYYDPVRPYATTLLLHEVAHGLLGHEDYRRDIELLTLERSAWEKARQLSSPLAVSIDENTQEDHLDTYRDWLHARSTCPDCSAIGHQVKKELYHCVSCDTRWRVNEARLCAFRRHKVIA